MSQKPLSLPTRTPPIDWQARANQFVPDFTPDRRRQLAEHLGLPEAILDGQEIGFSADDHLGPCWTFPERDGTGNIIGIIRRFKDGKKKAVYHSKRGLFTPFNWDKRDGPLFLVEGASDTFALIALGLNAIGRPNDKSGIEHLIELCRQLPEGLSPVILGDNDKKADGDWPGKQGAIDTAQQLANALGRPVAWVLPPEGSKDVREWVQAQKLPTTGEGITDDWHEAGEELLKELVANLKFVNPEPNHPDNNPPAQGDWQPPLPLNEILQATCFPIQVLPTLLASFVLKAATAVGCPVDFLAGLLLGIASGAIGASRVLKIKASHEHPALLYTVIIGQPGDAKSPALNLIAEPLYEQQREYTASYLTKRDKYEQELADYQAAKRNSAASNGVDEPKPPPGPVRLYVSDATRESIPPMLDENPRGATMLRDELSGLMASLNEYKRGQGSDRQFWLENWNGRRSPVDRKQQHCQPIRHPRSCLSVVGGIQPDLLGCFRDSQGRKDGWLDRFLPFFPEPIPVPQWTWEEVDNTLSKPWCDALKDLLALKLSDGNYGPEPQALCLTVEARKGWQSLQDSIAAEMNSDDFPPFLRGYWSKLRVYAGRLALDLHLLRYVTKETQDENVDAESVQRAGLLIEYFKNQWRKVLAVMEADPKLADARRVLGCLTKNPQLQDFTCSELLHDHFRKSFSQANLEAALGQLTRRHYVRAHQPDRNGTPGPNPMRYEVNPLWNRQSHTEVTGDSKDRPA